MECIHLAGMLVDFSFPKLVLAVQSKRGTDVALLAWRVHHSDGIWRGVKIHVYLLPYILSTQNPAPTPYYHLSGAHSLAEISKSTMVSQKFALFTAYGTTSFPS